MTVVLLDFWLPEC